MIKKLYPTAYFKSVFNIPLDALRKNGVKALVFDIDNTLSPHDCPEPDEKITGFIENALSEGFLICLLSNNSKERVLAYSKNLNIYSIHNALKPLSFGLKRAMALMGAEKHETVLIGDQVFTDVLCGNLAGIRTILVEPCSGRDQWVTKIKRGLEKKVVNKYLESRVKK